jgi:hypothetical protein
MFLFSPFRKHISREIYFQCKITEQLQVIWYQSSDRGRKTAWTRMSLRFFKWNGKLTLKEEVASVYPSHLLKSWNEFISNFELESNHNLHGAPMEHCKTSQNNVIVQKLNTTQNIALMKIYKSCLKISLCDDYLMKLKNTLLFLWSLIYRRCIQKFPDWPPGARTTNGKALCH